VDPFLRAPNDGKANTVDSGILDSGILDPGILDAGNRGPWNTTLAFLRKSPAENAHPEWSAAPNLNAIVCENHMNFGVCELILGPPAHSDKRGAFLPRQTHAKHRTTTSVQRHFSLPSTAIAGE
jgi:hypothetical protein